MGMRWSIGVLLAAMLLTPVGALSAAMSGAGASYAAALSGGEEVPPRTTPASGQATFQVSADGQSLTYTVTVSNITNVIAGHIHIGAKGANGDIVLPLVPAAQPNSGPKSGVIGQGTVTAAQLIGPLQGKTLADLVAQLDAGNAYVNIHTATGASPATQTPGDLPTGEIRGQIAATTAPTVMPAMGGGYGAGGAGAPWVPTVALLALGAAGIALRRRRA